MGQRAVGAIFVEITLDFGFSLIKETLDIVIGTNCISGHRVKAGQDITETTLKACNTDVGLVRVLGELSNERTLREFGFLDSGVVRRISGAEGPLHLIIMIIVELEELVDALLLGGIADLRGDLPI